MYDITELRDAIGRNSVSPEVLLSELWRVSTGHSRTARVYEPEVLELYRARLFPDNTRPRHVNDISYPPKSLAAIGRANREGQQVFYASAGVPSTFIETRCSAGHFIVVGKWVNTDSLILPTVGLEPEENALEDLYRDLFRANALTYRYTSEVAHHLMNGQKIDGLLYPSVLASHEHHNVVLKRATVDAKMRLKYAILGTITEQVAEEKYKVETLDFAKPMNDGSLSWAGRPHHWILREAGESFTFECDGYGWDWAVRDSNGNIREPE